MSARLTSRSLGHYPGPLLMNTSRLPRSSIPPVIPVRQRFDRPRVKNLAADTAAALAQVISDPLLVRGKVIGLTAPSRGIRDIGPVLRHLTGALRSLGAVPSACGRRRRSLLLLIWLPEPRSIVRLADDQPQSLLIMAPGAGLEPATRG